MLRPLLIMPFVLLLLTGIWGLCVAVAHVFFPFSIDYGEALTLTGALHISRGGLGAAYSYNMAYYRSPVLDYPPLFPILVAALKGLGLPLLAAGRALALLGCLAASGLLALLARREGAPRILVPACLIMPLGAFPFLWWAGVARIDSLALVLSLAGFHFSTYTGRSSSGANMLRLLLAALCFALALFTKQSMVAAPAAVIIAGLSLRQRRRDGLFLALLTLALGALLLFGMQWATGGNYLGIVTGERYSNFSLGETLFRYAGFALNFAALVALAVVGWWRLCSGFASVDLRGRALVLYWPFSAIVAGTIGKIGAAEYYLMELTVVTILLAIMGYMRLRETWASQLEDGRRHFGWPARLFALALLAQLIGMIGFTVITRGVQLDDFERGGAAQAAVAYIQAEKQGDVFSEVPGLLLVAGRDDQIYDRFILHQLTNAGLRDDRAELADFQRRRWRVVVLTFDPSGNPPGGLWDDRLWPAGTLQVLQQSYQRIDVLRLPDGRPQFYVLKPR